MLTIALVCATLTSTVFAAEKDILSSREIYTDKNLGAIFERIIDDKQVTVLIKSIDGSIEHTLVRNGDTATLDGEILDEQICNSVTKFAGSMNYFTSPALLRAPAAVNWEAWQTSSETINTGGLATVAIAGLIMLFSPWIGLSVAAVLAGSIAGKYDTVKIRWKMRYGTDNKYLYYERVTDFYGDGKHFAGPYKDRGKTAL